MSDERPLTIDDWCGLSKGQLYRYYIDDEIFVEGQVIFNDGVTAIIKVTDRYSEAYFDILYYHEVKQFVPSFYDSEAERLTEYFCIDIETRENPFFRDPDTGDIMHHHFDENGKHSFIPADATKFRMERLKKLFLHKLEEWQKNEKSKAEAAKIKYGTLIRVYILGNAIYDMYDEYDKKKGNPSSDDTLNYSLNRSLYWLNNRNCAILTAWRGNYSKAENNQRNQELQNSLRNLGYGVIRVKGCYAEVGRSIEKENSFLVFDLDDTPDFKDNIYEQSERYEQDCFLYKPLDEEVAYLIGTNDDFGKGKIVTAGALRINSNDAENFSEVASGRVSFEES